MAVRGERLASIFINKPGHNVCNGEGARANSVILPLLHRRVAIYKFFNSAPELPCLSRVGDKTPRPPRPPPTRSVPHEDFTRGKRHTLAEAPPSIFLHFTPRKDFKGHIVAANDPALIFASIYE